MYKALDSKVGIGLRVFFSMQHIILSGSVNKIWLNHRSMELRFVNGWVYGRVEYGEAGFIWK